MLEELFKVIFGLFGIFVLPGLVCEWAEKFLWKDDNSAPTQSQLRNYRSAIELQNRLDAWLNKVEASRASDKWKYGRDYERFIGYLFERKGYYVVYNGALEGKADGGIDLIACKDGFIHLIQCKRWRNLIGVEEIEKFANAVDRFERRRSMYESKLPHGYSKCKVMPIFYATNGYAKDAFNEAYWLDISLKTQPFSSIREYPPVKCVLQNGEKVYYLPFDRDFDRVHVGVYRGGCYKFTVFDAQRAGYRYVNNPNIIPVQFPSSKKNQPASEGTSKLKFVATSFAAVAFLFAVIPDSSTSKTSSPPARSYTHEDFRPTTRSYSAPQPDYRPIELPKAEPLPVTDLLPKTQVPILNASEPIAPPLVEENLADDKPSLDVPKIENPRKDFELDAELARKRADAYIEANRDRRQHDAQKYRNEPISFEPEPIPLPAEQKPIPSSKEFNWVSAGIPENSPRSNSFFAP